MTSNESVVVHRQPIIAQAERRKRRSLDNSGNILTARTSVKKQIVEVNANGDLALKKRPKSLSSVVSARRKFAGDHWKVQMNELNELRDQAYENSLIHKEKTKKIHDFKIKNHVFNIGDRVLLFNSRLKIFSGKLKTRWTGPFTVTQVFPYGTVELSQTDEPNFKVNGHRLKHYFRGDISPMVVSDLQTFPMDH
uniref:Reverse transcriptase domain-containing protein n=1 Tax=Tanacetum cinerariifolium TaxID=118510 RepID=A0A699HJ63_TANCI|nr:reverse transcriptase domain-containing protein [Tanacetum cinerariifolium]